MREREREREKRERERERKGHNFITWYSISFEDCDFYLAQTRKRRTDRQVGNEAQLRVEEQVNIQVEVQV